ncbi:MAG: SDR family NAD(P)-dependent oxidoreductase [Deltaproteobacteria bacterium]|nr:SDR family NAD(P)-dependent oxidoreductase [Deltaproteobacteria bacterium]
MAGEIGAKVLLVTGASSGIGREIVQRFSAGGWRVFATIRTSEDADSLARLTGVTPLICDLSAPGAADTLMDEFASISSRLDLLVNNAGFGVRGAIEDQTDAAIRAMFEVNVFAPTALARRAAMFLRNGGGGTIVNISSVTGELASPLSGTYAATKHALEAITDALRMELERDGIHVVSIQPGPVATRFMERSYRDSAPWFAASTRYTTDYAHARRGWDRTHASAIRPEVIADLVWRIAHARRPAPRYRRHFLARIAPHLVYWMPRRWLDRLLQRSTHLLPGRREKG